MDLGPIVSGWPAGLQTLGLLVVALAASWCLRRAIRSAIRRAVRRAPLPGWYRHRAADHDGDDADPLRLRQRADAIARLVGQAATSVVMIVATMWSLDRLGVDLAVSLSSAGFLGFALALSGQGVIRDLLEGTRSLLEDRYALGDEVVVRVGGHDVEGTVEVLGAASLRLRLGDGTTWQAGHDAIESVTNRSRPPVLTELQVAAAEWDQVDPARARDALIGSSNDVGLTGVVFLGDLADEPSDDETEFTIPVRANRPLTPPQRQAVRDRLLDAPRDDERGC